MVKRSVTMRGVGRAGTAAALERLLGDHAFVEANTSSRTFRDGDDIGFAVEELPGHDPADRRPWFLEPGYIVEIDGQTKVVPAVGAYTVADLEALPAAAAP